MIITEFPTVFGDVANRRTVSWDDLIAYCSTPSEYSNKNNCPLIKLASFGERRTTKGSLRHDTNLTSISGVEGDYDDGCILPSVAAQLLEYAGVRALIYTSPSHTPEKPRWRVLAPLSREHEPRDRRELIAKLNGALGGVLARESFSDSQTYYIGRVTGAPYEVHTSIGVPIDLALNLTPIYPIRENATPMPREYDEREITQDIIDDLRSALAMISTEEYQERISVGQALSCLGDIGYQLWEEWLDSAGREFAHPTHCKWTTFTADRTGFEAVYAKAQRNGWINPKSRTVIDTAGVFNGATAPLGDVIVPAVPGEIMPLHFKLDEFSWPDLSKRSKPQATGRNLEHLINSYGIKVYYDEILKDAFMVFPGEVNYANDCSENGKLQELKSLLAMNELPSETADRIPSILMKKSCNPIKEFITGVPWDGVSRLPVLYATVDVNPEDIVYRDAALRMWLIQCVAAMDGAKESPIPHKVPKFESVLVFQGTQGLYKSTWIGSLLPPTYREYVRDNITLDLSDKDSRKIALSAWIVELGELDGTFRKSDIAKLKGFLSLHYDSIRLPYDKLTSKFQRRTSYFASVNPERFLVDDTGNRRFIPLKVLRANAEHGLDMQQVWAEVWGLYSQGEQWWPDDALTDMVKVRHEEHSQIDPIEDAIRGKFNLDEKPKDGKIYSCTEILKECGWNVPTRADVNGVGRVLRSLGFEEYRSSKVRGYRLIARNLLAEKVFNGVAQH